MISALPDAPVGSVTTLPSYDPSDFNPTDAVLCRNTAPLITFAFDALARGLACHVVGRDIQIGLDKLIDQCDDGKQDHWSFRLKLQTHRSVESDKLRRKGKKEAAANLEDSVTAVLIITEKEKLTPNQTRTKVAALFANGTGLTLSTIHRAKGLEWDTVFLLDWALLPSRYAETPAAQQQERNLQYVGATRARLNLRFINSNNWKP